MGNCFEAQYKRVNGSNMQEISLMKKSIHWLINAVVLEKVTSGSWMFLDFWSIGKLHPISGSLLVLYRHLGKKMRNLTYSLTLKFLMLIVWNNLPG